jgi:hypothetical protein
LKVTEPVTPWLRNCDRIIAFVGPDLRSELPHNHKIILLFHTLKSLPNLRERYVHKHHNAIGKYHRGLTFVYRFRPFRPIAGKEINVMIIHINHRPFVAGINSLVNFNCHL